MGDSDKLSGAGACTNSFATHSYYLDGFIEASDLGQDLLLIVHHWGSALGFDWANRHRDAVGGIAYMEAIVRPFAVWREFNSQAAPHFEAFRTDAGEDLILNRNVFIEWVSTGAILRDLSDGEMEEYRRPVLHSAGRWPMLTWPRQIPVAGEPADVAAIIASYSEWMVENRVPKLFINAEPGAILNGRPKEFCRQWRHQQEVCVRGSHFIQEDSGAEIGRAITKWATSIEFLGRST